MVSAATRGSNEAFLKTLQSNQKRCSEKKLRTLIDLQKKLAENKIKCLPDTTIINNRFVYVHQPSRVIIATTIDAAPCVRKGFGKKTRDL